MSDLKLRTANTIKWNAIDRVSSQLLYAVVGVLLANILTPEDFGLVGALLVFQAFAILFVDSGFGAALLQRKDPTEEDYSTVFWFNLAVSIVVYIILFFCAPLIADIFQGDTRLIPLSKVMFLTFILNGLAIVQTNRLMKRMDVKQIAVANVIALVISGGVGIASALMGYGPWALVWQSVTLAGIKSAWLWITGHWWPRAGFHLSSLKKIWRIGLSVFSSSSLNTLCQNIYSFIIGAFYNLSALGYYTQADKWSKMGSASISQILTSSFVPLLSRVQDDREAFRRYVTRINRFTAFILFPVMLGIATLGAPLFHTLFGNKWDAAILLFQLLTIRGIFIVLISLYSNYLLSLGYGKRLFIIELIKDSLIIIAILSTVWFDSVTILVWGQLASAFITWVIALGILCHATGYNPAVMIRDLFPSFAITFISCAMTGIFIRITHVISPQLPSFFHNVHILGGSLLLGGLILGLGGYLILCRLCHLSELNEAITYLRGRLR